MNSDLDVVVIERSPQNDAMVWLSALMLPRARSAHYLDPEAIALPNRAEIRLLLDLVVPTPASKAQVSPPLQRLTEEQLEFGRGSILR